MKYSQKKEAHRNETLLDPLIIYILQARKFGRIKWIKVYICIYTRDIRATRSFREEGIVECISSGKVESFLRHVQRED